MASPSSASRPSIRVVSRDEDDLAVVVGEIERRYGADYDVRGWSEPDAALEELRRLQTNGGHVALVIATEHGTGDGVEFLGRVRAIDSQAKRAVVVRWGDFASSRTVVEALARGALDRWVLRPEYPADEEFHHSVTELLGDWAAARRPRYEAVQIIDDRWSPRAVELRDRLNRNSVPVGFYDRGSDEGRELMAAHGFSVATAELPSWSCDSVPMSRLCRTRPTRCWSMPSE